MFYKLNQLGLSTKVLNLIKNLYETTKCSVWTGEELSEPFETIGGVKQGCLLSPLLFSLYLNDLYEFLEGGLDVEGTNVRLLMYADDIVILSEHPNVLQKMIHNLEKFTKIWNLEVNMSKSKIMVFRNGGRLADYG